MISIIIPTLDEAKRIRTLIESVRDLSFVTEVIVADGGSADATVALARAAGARVIPAARGRGAQLHTGAMAARGEILWFVHADSTVPLHCTASIVNALERSEIGGGTFRLLFDGSHLYARAMTFIYRALQRIGFTYGDASIFVRRGVYADLGGFRALPIFEDVDFIHRLRSRGFHRLDAELTTSSRRFDSPVAFVRAWTLWTMLHLLYWLGAPVPQLARWYRCMR